MKEIHIAYWYKGHEEKVGIPHNSIFKYSKEKRNEVIDQILDSGFNILLQQSNDVLIIWIDDKRFQQR